MNCPKCGAILQQNSKFCKFCGTNIKYVTDCKYGDNISNSEYDSTSCHNEQFNYSYNYSNKTKPEYNLNQSHQDQYNYNNLYSNKFNYIKTETIGDERYLEVYVGPNYKIIKNSKFSIGTLLFGGIHLLYRKLYGYAFLYFFLIIAAEFLVPEFSTIIRWIVNFILALKFNSIYMEHVENKVEQIKQSNFDKTSTELLEECRKKGGVSLKAALFTPIAIALIVIIAIITIYGIRVFEELEHHKEPETEIVNNDNNINSNSTISEIESATTNSIKISQNLNELNYKIQTEYTPNYIDNNYTIYTYNNNPNELSNQCEIHVLTDTKTQYEFYNQIKESVTNSKKIMINNKAWTAYYTFLTDKDINYYTYYHNNKLYIIQTRTNTKNKACDILYSEMLSTLSFN